MGIKLIDVANFAIGAIEKDRELTKENLAIRAQELQDNRDFLRDQKKKKYDKELQNYYDEKEKFDIINKANEMYDLKSIDARTYAATILPLTNPNWKNLDDKTKQLNINNFDGKTIDYKLIGSEEEINKQAAIINQKINSETATAIKDAKGNSFLINKILGEKKQAERDLLKEVEEKIKAADTVKMSEQNVNQEYVGKDVKVSSSTAAFSNDPNADKYQTEWAKQRDKIEFDILSGTKGIRFLNSAAISGGSDELSFKYDKTDSKITGMNDPSIAHVEATRYMFNQIKDSNDTMIKHYNTVTNLYGNIGKTWNEETIFKQMEKEIPDRAGNINQGYGNPLVDNIRLTTIVPLSIVPLGATIDGKPIDTGTMKNINASMNKYIVDKTKVLKDGGYFKDLNSQQIATFVYKKLYEGDKSYLNEFQASLPKEEINIEKTITTDTDSDAPPPPKSKYKLSPNKDSFVIDGSEVTFDSVLKNNEEDKLPSELVGPYNEWKSKQNNSENKKVSKGTTYEDMQKNTQATNKKIKDSFTNFSQNMKNMKSNTQYGNQNPLKSS